jgi:hypothetical protein
MTPPRLLQRSTSLPSPAATNTSSNTANQSKIFSIQREGFVVPLVNDKVIVENVNTQFVGRAQWINDNGDVRFIRHEPSYDETSPESHLLISEVNGDQVFPFKVSLHVKTNLGALPKITLAHCGCGGRGAGYCEHIGATLYALRDYRLTGANFIHYGEQFVHPTRRAAYPFRANSNLVFIGPLRRFLEERRIHRTLLFPYSSIKKI